MTADNPHFSGDDAVSEPRPSATERRHRNVEENRASVDEDDEDTIIDGPQVLSSVSMALTFRKFPS